MISLYYVYVHILIRYCSTTCTRTFCLLPYYRTWWVLYIGTTYYLPTYIYYSYSMIYIHYAINIIWIEIIRYVYIAVYLFIFIELKLKCTQIWCIIQAHVNCLVYTYCTVSRPQLYPVSGRTRLDVPILAILIIHIACAYRGGPK